MSSSPEWATWLIQAYAIQQQQQQGITRVQWVDGFRRKMPLWYLVLTVNYFILFCYKFFFPARPSIFWKDFSGPALGSVVRPHLGYLANEQRHGYHWTPRRIRTGQSVFLLEILFAFSWLFTSFCCSSIIMLMHIVTCFFIAAWNIHVEKYVIYVSVKIRRYSVVLLKCGHILPKSSQ